jgi:acyl carrier protein
MDFIFYKLKTILHEKFSFHYDQIQLETQLELELGMDSREMFELIKELEKMFEVQIDLDEIDSLFESKKILRIDDVVNYLKEKQCFESS